MTGSRRRLTKCDGCGFDAWPEHLSQADDGGDGSTSPMLCITCASQSDAALTPPIGETMARTPTQEPMFKLTEKEKADLGGQLAQLECTRIVLEVEFAVERKAHKERIDGLDEQIQKIAATINQAGDHQ